MFRSCTHDRPRFSKLSIYSAGLICHLLVSSGCSADFRPLISDVLPLNGSTNVAVTIEPEISFASKTNVELESGDQRVLLVDVTGGGLRTVGGKIDLEGVRIKYLPDEPLPTNHYFELIVDQQATSGNKLLQLDGSEWPEEELRWPFRLRFSTFSHPRVRGVYLDRSRDNPRLFIRFSQPIDQVASTGQFELQDQLQGPVAFSTPVWVDDHSARLDLQASLDPSGLYTLIIRKDLQASDGATLDGNDNGKPGEEADDFAVKFTGSQKVVLSRQPDAAQ